MATRHPRRAIPRVWLMTDERAGEALWAALERLPRGAGVVFRHHASGDRARRALLGRVMQVARRRRLTVIRTGRVAVRGEAGTHGSTPRHRGLLHARSAHHRTEAIAARRAGADLVFVSPLHPTRTHPGARPLGACRAASIISGLGIPAIALGGMTRRRFAGVRALGFHGWAAIDALH